MWYKTSKKIFVVKNTQGSPLGDKKKRFLVQQILPPEIYELSPIWACTPKGPLCPQEKSFLTRCAVKSFNFALILNFAPNFFAIYTKADRAIKDESIGIL